jgi:hypothetical protein
MVEDFQNTTVLVPYKNQKQVNYMLETNLIDKPETINFLSESSFGLRGEHYLIDLSENESPGDLSADSTWKGLYFYEATILIPEDAETSNQLSCDNALEVNFLNEDLDSNRLFVDNNGLNFEAIVDFDYSDTLKFNDFPSIGTELHVNITENFLNEGECIGDIQIPVIDTARFFPYTIPLTSFGFQLGNIDESLIDLEFVFNAAGGDEQTVDMKITRAIFKGQNRIEMDIDAVWQHFDATLPNLQGFSAWGNGNIGFDVPNGAASVNNQALALGGDYNMVIG